MTAVPAAANSTQIFLQSPRTAPVRSAGTRRMGVYVLPPLLIAAIMLPPPSERIETEPSMGYTRTAKRAPDLHPTPHSATAETGVPRVGSRFSHFVLLAGR